MRDPDASSDLLHYGKPLADAQSLVVLLHGRGATAESMLPLAEAIAVDGTAFLAPQAAGRAWYPQSFLAPLRQNEPWLSSALRTVGTAVDHGLAAGLPASSIALVGFSQGACLALEYAARNPERVAVAAGLSGGLIGSGEMPGAAIPEDKLFEYPGVFSGLKVFLGCSDVDSHIPLNRVERSAAVFSDKGANVDLRIYPNGGHTVFADEVEAVRDLMEGLSDG